MTNEDLVALIVKIDPGARSWVYNWYCGNCARYFYPDDKASNCKKCGVPYTSAISRALPFTTSATALEKLFVWLRDQVKAHPVQAIEGILFKLALSDAQIQLGNWVEGDYPVAQYRQRVVDAIYDRLAVILKQRSGLRVS